jgi:hypothetical protein
LFNPKYDASVGITFTINDLLSVGGNVTQHWGGPQSEPPNTSVGFGAKLGTIEGSVKYESDGSWTGTASTSIYTW